MANDYLHLRGFHDKAQVTMRPINKISGLLRIFLLESKKVFFNQPQRASTRMNISPRAIMIIGMALFCGSAWASHPPTTPIHQFHQDVWTTRDGLPHNSINGITQTADGRLWLATWEGAVRFNGHQFEVFDLYSDIGLNDSGIMNVQTTTHGDIMLMGARGSLVYREQQQWYRVETAEGLITHVLFEPDGSRWVATAGSGLLYSDTQGNTRDVTRELDSSVLQVSFLLPHDGHLYATSSIGLLRFEQQQPTLLGAAYGLPQAAANHLVWYQDQLLVATDQGIYQLRDDGRFELYRDELANIAFTRFLVDHNDDLWIGSVSQGLFRVSSYGIEQLTSITGLPNNRVISLFEDAEFSLWVGTNGGLFRLRDAPFTTMAKEDGLAGNYVRTVMTHSDGSLWVGSSNGLSVKTSQGWQPINLPEDAKSVLSLAERNDGSIFIGTFGGGLLQWKDGQIIKQWTVQEGLLANTISTILTRSNGEVWLGSFNGIDVINSAGGRAYTLNARPEAQLTIAFYEDDDHTIWIGTGRGVLRYRDEQFTFIDLSAANGANYVFDIEPIDGWLWMSTDRGLVRFNRDELTYSAVGTRNGLPVDKVFQVQADHYGHLWLTSNRGVMRVNYSELNALLDSGAAERLTQVDWYRESDGMISSQANGGSNPAIAIDADGMLWIPSAHGLVMTDPSRVDSYTESAPPSVIEQVMIDSQPVNLGSQPLQSRSGAITIEYSGIGFIVPERIEYSTRLLGFDNQWRQRGRQTLAEFTNLAPGDYQFEVSASYNNGRSSGVVASVSFTVLPKFWQQSWFWLLVALAAMFMIVAIIHARTRVLRIRAIQLQAQVAEKTRQLQQQAQMFEQLSQQDSLTKLPNRRGFDLELQRQWAIHQRKEQPMSLAIVDVDHFKAINDNYSHQVGDQALHWVAQELQRVARESDVLARWGGEEFTLLMPQTDLATAVQVCERIRSHIADLPAPNFLPERTIKVSIGVACSSDHPSTQHLLAKADTALYQAKSEGRNCVRAG